MDCDCTSNDYNDVKDTPCQDWESCNSSNGDRGFGPPRKKAKNGKGKCMCKACGKVYSYSTNSGTSTLDRHILECPMILKSRNVGDMMTDHPETENLGVGKLDQKVVRDLITQMVIQHDLPFQFVEWDGFRAFTKYISSDEVQCVSKDTVIADVMKVYLLEKEKLKNQLAKISGRVCLTCHCWTSSATCGYVTLTAHYIDENWKLNIKLLNCFHLEPPHTEFKLSKKVFRCLKEWGIDKKIFSVTLDNASSDANLQNLKMMLCLSDSLLCNGDFFRVKCGAHVLDLIVQEGLKVANVVLHKIRKGVKYVSVSESRLKQFFQYVEEVGGINTGGLHLDVPSKWTSTYMMLKTAIKYRPAFKCLHSIDMDYRHYPSDEEWARGEKMCELLRPFYELTNMISNSTHLTSTTYFRKIWVIMVLLKQNKLSEDLMIRDMSSKLTDEFDKYFSEHSMILAFGCVLNPCLKFQFLKIVYSKLYSSIEIVEEKLRNVREALDALLKEYANKWASTSTRCSTSTNKGEEDMSIMDEFLEWEENERQKEYAAGKTQLDLYLEEPRQYYVDDSKVLDYWNNTAYSLGDLAMMARDILSIPIITVSSNSAFSIGGRFLNKYKSCMLSKNLQALICSRNWLFGFSHSDQCGDVIEETHKVDINLYKQGSNSIVSDDSDNED